ncbi:MAG: hypothetical protein ABI647_12665 [Gemmatimonadota bacterium]
MRIRPRSGAIAAALASIAVLSAFQAGRKPEEELVEIVKAYLSETLSTDWEGIEKLPKIKWAPLPPAALKNCLPDGGCFARQGVATIGGGNVAVIATGARTIVFNIYFRNGAAAWGEAPVAAALKQAAVSAELARCPIRTGAGGTSWYRLKGASLSPGYLSVQPAGAGRPNEGFAVYRTEALPRLQPNQLALYSEKCAEGVERKPVSTVKPHEQLAATITSLLVPAAGPTLYDWKALAGLSDIAWDSAGPKKWSGEANPLMQSGHVTYGGREFSLAAGGTPTQVKAVSFEEVGMHPKGEHMLGVVYEKGIAVQLVRCGPIYTESTNNWYSLTSPKTRPAMVKQSIRYEGNQVQDSYELRLDGTLPARDPRDRNPGVNGC